MKRTLALLLALVMVFALAACGSKDNASGSAGGDAAAPSGDGLTIFNSKMEIQSQMEEMAARYSEEKGIPVEVYYSSDTVAAHMSTRYASNEPYALAMVDAKDIYSLGPEHAVDLSGEQWVGDTTQAISVDGKVLGFPVCVEARGLLYNGDAIRKPPARTSILPPSRPPLISRPCSRTSLPAAWSCLLVCRRKTGPSAHTTLRKSMRCSRIPMPSSRASRTAP